MMLAAAVPLTTPTAPVNTTLRATDASYYVCTQEEEAPRCRHLECGKVCPMSEKMNHLEAELTELDQSYNL